ncbi:MAG: polymer-forming cytoskeletal protein [Candidatus Acidiferrum sp.]
MWNKQQTQPEAPAAPPPQSPASTPAVVAFAAPSSPRAAASPSRSSALLGSSLHITGQLTGTEDLQIDGKVDGPISLNGHQLTVGPTAILNSEVSAGAVIVFGKVVGNVHARGRVDIKTDGSVVGDISTARISIEDGAHFKGRIEIDPAKAQSATAG